MISLQPFTISLFRRNNIDYNWIDPTLFPINGDILVVLVDDRRGFLGWFIKAHESGNYNHAMFMVKKGMLDSQANVFKEIPVMEYMKDGVFLKFWRIKNLSDSERILINDAITKMLAKPWWGRMYDIVGLFGQSFSFLHWVQIPGLYFCSEVIAAFIKKCPRFSWLSQESSPSDLDKLFRNHTDDMEVLGYWFSD